MKLLGICEVNEFSDWNLFNAISGLQNAGFEIIERNEAAGFTIFKDLEALISYIKVINWLIPDFSKKKYRIELDEISRIIRIEGCFNSTLDRFFLLAEKKKL
ncbi:MAG: hypothetical protein K8I03_04680 [Ignavibacteria bacterium]|nr:hypothetical protein [Ignavibacteria bacterium]